MMMKHKKWGIVMSIILCGCGSPTHGEIISTPTMKLVEAKVELALERHQPKDIWVGFDIDMTLLQPDHPAAYYPNLKKHKAVYGTVMGGSPRYKKIY